jgi:hypothetical protein
LVVGDWRAPPVGGFQLRLRGTRDERNGNDQSTNLHECPFAKRSADQVGVYASRT